MQSPQRHRWSAGERWIVAESISLLSETSHPLVDTLLRALILHNGCGVVQRGEIPIKALKNSQIDVKHPTTNQENLTRLGEVSGDAAELLRGRDKILEN